MKILVTGGKGFIGAMIVEMLCKDHSVIVVDNEDTYGIMTKAQLNKLFEWRMRNWDSERVSFIRGDILDRNTCLKAFSHHPDVVIHLATYPRAKIVDNDPTSSTYGAESIGYLYNNEVFTNKGKTSNAIKRDSLSTPLFMICLLYTSDAADE